jgi:DNA ligase D-like protein (predicted 3'-phosphoesterase)
MARRVTFKPGVIRPITRLCVWLWSLIRFYSGNFVDVVMRRDRVERRAIRLRQVFEDGGPTFAKLGQQISMRADMLPYVYCAELAKMLDQAPHFPVEQAIATIERNTGKSLSDIFEVFDPVPIRSRTLPAGLSEYRRKRNFGVTTEPRGGRIQRHKKLTFVIQKHAASRLHYDLRLEVNGVFKSWAVTKGPSLAPRDRRLAVEVEDHPLDYGDFEGTIPQGEYGGGTVMLWDRGFWAPEDGGDPERALRKGELKFTLAGEKLQGSWVIVRMRS